MIKKTKKKMLSIAGVSFGVILAVTGFVTMKTDVSADEADGTKYIATNYGTEWEGYYGANGYVIIGDSQKTYYTDMQKNNDGKTAITDSSWGYTANNFANFDPKEGALVNSLTYGTVVWGTNGNVRNYNLCAPGSSEQLKTRAHQNANQKYFSDVYAGFGLATEDTTYVTVNVSDHAQKVSAQYPITVSVYASNAKAMNAEAYANNPNPDRYRTTDVFYGGTANSALASTTITKQSGNVTFELKGAGEYRIVAWYDNPTAYGEDGNLVTTGTNGPVFPQINGYFFDSERPAALSSADVVSESAVYGSDWERSPYGQDGYIVLNGEKNKFYSDMYSDAGEESAASSGLQTASGWTNNNQNTYLTVEGKELRKDLPIDKWAVCSQNWQALPDFAGAAIESSLYAPSTTESTSARVQSGWDNGTKDMSVIVNKSQTGIAYLTVYINNLGGSNADIDVAVYRGAVFAPHASTDALNDYYGGKPLAKTTVNKLGSYVTFKLDGKGAFQIVVSRAVDENGTVTGTADPMITGLFFDGEKPSLAWADTDSLTGTNWEGTYGKDGYVILDYDLATSENIAYTKGIYNSGETAYTGKVAYTTESLAYNAANVSSINTAPEWKVKNSELSLNDSLVSRYGMNVSMYEYKVWLDGSEATNGRIYKDNMLKKPGAAETVAVRAGGRNNANEGVASFTFTVTEKAVQNGALFVTTYHNNCMDGYKDNANYLVSLYNEYHSSTVKEQKPNSMPLESIEATSVKNTNFYTTFKISKAGDYSIRINPDMNKARGTIMGVFFDKEKPVVSSTAGTYNITYVIEDGTNAAENPSTYTFQNGVAAFAEAIPDDADASFDGWYQDETRSSKPISSVPAGMNVDLTLYAKIIKPFVITYEIGSGTNNAENPLKANSGDSIILKDAVAPARHYFEGWYTSADFTENTKVVGSYTVTGNVTFYAKYSEVEKFTITYVLDGGTNSEDNPVEFYSGEGVTSFAAATKEGYTFKGWYLDEEFESEIKSIPVSYKNNVTLYAKFEKNIVTSNISYVLDGGTNAAANPATYEEGTAVTLAVATKEGYTFEGWYTDSAFTNKVTEISAETTGDVTLYAKFVLNSSGNTDNPSDNDNPGDNDNSGDNDNASDGEKDNESGKKGCKGSVALGVPVIALIAVAAVIFKKKKED